MKRKASERLEERITKKQKVTESPIWRSKERIEIAFSSSSEELSSELPDVVISQILKPQELESLREDPWSRNIYHATWTNEYTIVVDPMDSDRNSSKPAPLTATSTTLPNDFFWHILLNSDLQELVRWRLVSKYFDRLMLTSPKLWQSCFYRQRWRLPHEIRNYNEREDPRYSEIVINEKKVDWFSECKRNYLNAKRIKDQIEEISKKLPELIKPYAKRRKAGKTQRARMFDPGLTDEELDAWEDLHEFKLPNDFRELYKCMNGARFKSAAKIDEVLWGYEGVRPPPICFPKLDTIKVLPVKWIEFQDDEESAVLGAAVTQLATSPFTKKLTPVPLFTQSELDSDGSSYSMSGQEDSYSDQSEETRDNTAVLKVLHFGEYCIDDTGYVEDMIYEPIGGAIMSLDPESSPATLPIVEYLQHLCDIIDNDKRGPLLFTFTDFIVNAQRLRKQVCDEEGEVRPVDGELKYWLAECNNVFGYFHDCYDYIPVRAVQLLKVAAEDFVVKVFARAQSMETSDALQAETFVAAARDLGYEYFPWMSSYYKFEKATDVTSRLNDDVLGFWVKDEDENGRRTWVYKPLDTSTIDFGGKKSSFDALPQVLKDEIEKRPIPSRTNRVHDTERVLVDLKKHFEFKYKRDT